MHAPLPYLHVFTSFPHEIQNTKRTISNILLMSKIYIESKYFSFWIFAGDDGSRINVLRNIRSYPDTKCEAVRKIRLEKSWPSFQLNLWEPPAGVEGHKLNWGIILNLLGLGCCLVKCNSNLPCWFCWRRRLALQPPPPWLRGGERDLSTRPRPWWLPWTLHAPFNWPPWPLQLCELSIIWNLCRPLCGSQMSACF